MDFSALMPFKDTIWIGEPVIVSRECRSRVLNSNFRNYFYCSDTKYYGIPKNYIDNPYSIIFNLNIGIFFISRIISSSFSSFCF